MNVTFLVTIELRRESGKFAARDEVVDALREMIEQNVEEVDGVGADGDSVYAIEDISVDEHVEPKKRGA